MKYKLSTLLLLGFFMITSCKPSKHYSSCGDMSSSLRDDNYTDLVKDWGEPIQKDYYAPNNEWLVKWSGVGYDGNDDAIFHFKNLDLSEKEYSGNMPFTVIGVECK